MQQSSRNQETRRSSPIKAVKAICLSKSKTGKNRGAFLNPCQKMQPQQQTSLFCLQTAQIVTVCSSDASALQRMIRNTPLCAKPGRKTFIKNKDVVQLKSKSEGLIREGSCNVEGTTCKFRMWPRSQLFSKEEWRNCSGARPTTVE